MYIVHTSRGEYSDYSLEEVFVGEVDPTPILDAAVRQLSDGRWATLDAMNKYGWAPENSELTRSVRGQLLDELRRHGFRPAEHSLELWLG